MDLFGDTACGGPIAETEWAQEARAANRAKREERRLKDEQTNPQVDLCPRPEKNPYCVVNNEDGMDDVRTLISTWPDPEPIKLFLEKMRETKGNRMTTDFRAKMAVYWKARAASGALKKTDSSAEAG